jgi:hypothetical protein
LRLDAQDEADVAPLASLEWRDIDVLPTPRTGW